MKKEVVAVLIFCILLISLGVLLMITQILHFGGLTGLVIFDDAYGKDDFTFLETRGDGDLGTFGIAATLIAVSGALIFLIFRIKGKKFSAHVEHDLR